MSDEWPSQNERDDVDASEEYYEQEKQPWKKNGKLDPFHLSVSEDKTRKINGQAPKFYAKNLNAEDDLNALLQVQGKARKLPCLNLL